MTKTILVVDDERSIRESLCKVLHAEDYAVVCAENGQHAVEEFGAQKIDLLLLDLGMPVKDGWHTVIWLAQVNPLLPIIIITGRRQQRELAEKMGADVLMEKPLNVPCLLETIRELINEPLECRARRAKNRTSGFRHVACDHEVFRKHLNEAFTTPYPCPWYEGRLTVATNPNSKPNAEDKTRREPQPFKSHEKENPEYW
jgi:DNA-binding response OmpR family regulator